jgi:methylthioribose-1-phosphate isomerase
LSTIDLDTPDGESIPIEERSMDEVAGYRDLRWAPQGIRIANPVFDVTPAELVSALITERGVVRSPDRTSLQALLAG